MYDGHGRDGDKCAQFVRDTLPTLLAKGMTKARENGQNDGAATELTKEETQDIIFEAHRECNLKMHSQNKFDDTLSGTTSISVYLHGNTNRITVSNVGDSRTIIGRQASEVENGSSSTGGALKAFALSRDQTPYRRDERVRIRRTGGRILSLDQIEGLEPIREDEKERDELALKNGGGEDIILGEEIDESGDPPRVWSPNGDYPGTAFTRSIGDAIAEELGVHADPEMLNRELTPEDKIIVIASDGVFEFLTNQSVIDICAKFSDPLEACKAVVAESYELWLQYELRTDDITMICMFLDSVDASSKILRGPSDSLSTTEMVGESLNEDDALVSESSRPVRKNISLEKSRALEKMKAEMNSVHDVTNETEEDFDIEALYNEKSEEEKTCIAEAIRASIVFQNITITQRELLYKVMEPMKVKAGEWIIKQGTVGDRFYIVQFGTFEVRILPEGTEDSDGTGGNTVHVYEGSREKDQHPCFGELALMYSTPRAASIIAKTDGMLWALHRFAFKKVTAERGSREGAVEILTKIDQLKCFSADELEDLASYLCEAKYTKGDVLIQQGEVGESIFVMLPGGGAEALVQTTEDDAERTLSDNDHFGEEILEMSSQKRYASTVKATGKISCWTLSRNDVKNAKRRSSKE